MQTIEFVILDWIQENLRCGFLDVFMPAVSKLSNNGEIWILTALLLLLFKRYRQGWSVGMALILDLISCNLILKPLISRLRPCMVNTAVELLIKAPSSGSFPSGHTAGSFAAVFGLYFSGSPLWKPAAVLASVIAVSRMYLYVHWPTDILGGILLGFAVGWLGAKITEQAAEKLKK